MRKIKTPRERMEARERCQKANAAFTDAEVRRIRKDCEGGRVSYLELAKAWGCGMQTIRKIHRQETYSWVIDEGGEIKTNNPEQSYTVETRQDKDELLIEESQKRFLERFGADGLGNSRKETELISVEAIQRQEKMMSGGEKTAQEIMEENRVEAEGVLKVGDKAAGERARLQNE